VETPAKTEPLNFLHQPLSFPVFLLFFTKFFL